MTVTVVGAKPSPVRRYVLLKALARVAHIVDLRTKRTVCGRPVLKTMRFSLYSDAFVHRFAVRVCEGCDRMKDADTMRTIVKKSA